jgi:hypothetical protein
MREGTLSALGDNKVPDWEEIQGQALEVMLRAMEEEDPTCLPSDGPGEASQSVKPTVCKPATPRTAQEKKEKKRCCF